MQERDLCSIWTMQSTGVNREGDVSQPAYPQEEASNTVCIVLRYPISLELVQIFATLTLVSVLQGINQYEFKLVFGTCYFFSADI